MTSSHFDSLREGKKIEEYVIRAQPCDTQDTNKRFNPKFRLFEHLPWLQTQKNKIYERVSHIHILAVQSYFM